MILNNIFFPLSWLFFNFPRFQFANSPGLLRQPLHCPRRPLLVIKSNSRNICHLVPIFFFSWWTYFSRFPSLSLSRFLYSHIHIHTHTFPHLHKTKRKNIYINVDKEVFFSVRFSKEISQKPIHVPQHRSTIWLKMRETDTRDLMLDKYSILGNSLCKRWMIHSFIVLSNVKK